MADVKIENEGTSSKDGLNSLKLSMDHEVVKTENEGHRDPYDINDDVWSRRHDCKIGDPVQSVEPAAVLMEGKIARSKQRLESYLKTSKSYKEIESHRDPYDINDDVWSRSHRDPYDINDDVWSPRYDCKREDPGQSVEPAAVLMKGKIARSKQRFESYLKTSKSYKEIESHGDPYDININMWNQREIVTRKHRIESSLKTSKSYKDIERLMAELKKDILGHEGKYDANVQRLESSRKTSDNYDEMKRTRHIVPLPLGTTQRMVSPPLDNFHTHDQIEGSSTMGELEIVSPFKRLQIQRESSGEEVEKWTTMKDFDDMECLDDIEHTHIMTGHSCHSLTDLRKMIVENFSTLIDEINPSTLVQYINEPKPDLEHCSAAARKKRAVIFLLELLLNYASAIPSFWNAVKLEHKYCYQTIIEKGCQSPEIPDEQICLKCSDDAFETLYKTDAPIPLDLYVFLFENHCLQTREFLQIVTCNENSTQIQIFQNSLHFCDAKWNKPLYALSTKEFSENKGISDKMGFSPCSDCKIKSVSSASQNEEQNVMQQSVQADCHISMEIFFDENVTGNIALATINIEEGKQEFVEAILEEQEDINSSIKLYGKIKNAWSGSVVITFEITRGAQNSKVEKEGILNMIRHFTECKAVQKHLVEKGNEIKIRISLCDEDHLDVDLVTKQAVISQHFDTIRDEINAKDFLDTFSLYEIMNACEFKTKFPFEEINRSECSRLFLEYILQSGRGEVLEAFFEVIHRTYTFLAKNIHKSITNTRVKVVKTFMEDELVPQSTNSNKEFDGVFNLPSTGSVSNGANSCRLTDEMKDEKQEIYQRDSEEFDKNDASCVSSVETIENRIANNCQSNLSTENFKPASSNKQVTMSLLQGEPSPLENNEIQSKLDPPVRSNIHYRQIELRKKTEENTIQSSCPNPMILNNCNDDANNDSLATTRVNVQETFAAEEFEHSQNLEQHDIRNKGKFRHFALDRMQNTYGNFNLPSNKNVSSGVSSLSLEEVKEENQQMENKIDTQKPETNYASHDSRMETVKNEKENNHQSDPSTSNFEPSDNNNQLAMSLLQDMFSRLRTNKMPERLTTPIRDNIQRCTEFSHKSEENDNAISETFGQGDSRNIESFNNENISCQMSSKAYDISTESDENDSEDGTCSISNDIPNDLGNMDQILRESQIQANTHDQKLLEAKLKNSVVLNQDETDLSEPEDVSCVSCVRLAEHRR